MSDFWAQHGAHVIVMGGPVLLLLVMLAALQLDGKAAVRRDGSRLRALVALCWAGAATVHLLVIREHFAEAAVLGVFFAVVAATQYAYAVTVVILHSRRLLLTGLVANVGMIGLWAYTRVVSVPFGLGGREHVGAADVTATAFEAVAVVLAAVALRRQRSALVASELLAAGAGVRGGGAGPVLVVDSAADSAVVA